MIKFENSFHKLNADFYENVIPSKPPKPELISFNKSLSYLLGIKISWIESIEGLECFTGKKVIKNSNPLAMVYAGHQFGNWVPRLGDGRAILLGEILDQNNERWDIQLKGSGLTPFSRNGDGKAALGPILREYLMSEAMYKLGIPTTLALFIAKTGENVYRDKVFPGAIITRVAKSHIRVGTFQYFASLGKYNLVKELMDYVIKRNFPEINTDKNSKIANGAEDFHSDVSCDIEPPLGTMLQLHVLPECGGDTMFANMYMAFEALSNPMQKFLSDLKASHESEHFYRGRYKAESNGASKIEYPSAIHPVIRTHPETGKKAIFVNKFFTTRILGLKPQESKFILDFLFSHIEKTEFQIRYRWNKNDMAFWDNRCTLHKAIWDYFPNERKGRRVTIKGDKPI